MCNVLHIFNCCFNILNGRDFHMIAEALRADILGAQGCYKGCKNPA